MRETLSKKSLWLFFASSFGVHALLLVFKNSGSVGLSVNDLNELCEPLNDISLFMALKSTTFDLLHTQTKSNLNDFLQRWKQMLAGFLNRAVLD